MTLPICTRQHFCETTGCSNNPSIPRFCNCDMACRFYDDCCIDYKDVCSLDENDFQNTLASGDIREADMQCVIDYNTGYRMITTCNKDTLENLKERCENPICNDSLSNVPVMDSIGISYRNVYCALCHNVETSELTAWKATFRCDEKINDRSLQDQKSPNELDTMCSNSSTCRLSLLPPDLLPSHALPMRKCQPPVISTCRNKSKDANISCKRYTAMVEFDSVIFKNPHCLLCNRDNFTDLLSCKEEGIPDYKPRDYIKPPKLPVVVEPPDREGGHSYSILLNFKDSARNSLNIQINNQETVVNCKEGEVFVGSRDGRVDCVKISCSSGFKLQDGDCIPEMFVKDTPCDNRGNNTVMARILITNGSCHDESIRKTVKRVLMQLFDRNLSSEISFREDSFVCKYDLQKTIAVSYIVFGSVDLFANIQDRLNSRSVIGNFLQQNVTGISNKITELEISQSCLNPDLEYKCDPHWISDNEYKLERTNTSYLVFLNETSEWITADGIVFRIRYENDNGEFGLQKHFEVKICHDNYLSCPFLTMNVSLFEILNSTGEIRYLPDGRILKSTEYEITSGDEILVCNFFNQSGLITETVTFFDYSNAQIVVSMIGGVLSLIAIILTLITYVIFDILRKRASRLIMNLLIALFLAQFLLLFGGNQTENEDICFVIAVIAHYAWLAAFAWMNALAFELDKVFGKPNNLKKLNEVRKDLFLYMTYAWGSPLLIVIPCIVIHFCQCTTISFRYGSSNACWISDGTANLLTFGVPAAFFVLVNGVLFGHTVVGIRSAMKASARIRKAQSSNLKQNSEELIIYIKVRISIYRNESFYF